MDKLTPWLLPVCLLFVGLATTARADDGPNYQVSYPEFQYGITVSSLRELDFRNLTVFWHRTDKPEPAVQLKDGSFARRYEPGGGGDVSLDLVKVLEGGRYAVIDVMWRSCGGSCSENGLVQVFELVSGHPTVIEQIRYERHAPQTGASIDGSSRILTVSGRSSEPSPNCCPRSVDVMTFQWDGKQFVFTTSRRDALPGTP